ncbi:hypothetical protein A2U01_0100254, partial [Trifolium medium]|nr:hypothetical protein [Trifolium medium]
GEEEGEDGGREKIEAGAERCYGSAKEIKEDGENSEAAASFNEVVPVLLEGDDQ